jgi:hypothetical protein
LCRNGQKAQRNGLGSWLLSLVGRVLSHLSRLSRPRRARASCRSAFQLVRERRGAADVGRTNSAIRSIRFADVRRFRRAACRSSGATVAVDRPRHPVDCYGFRKQSKQPASSDGRVLSTPAAFRNPVGAIVIWTMHKSDLKGKALTVLVRSTVTPLRASAVLCLPDQRGHGA